MFVILVQQEFECLPASDLPARSTEQTCQGHGTLVTDAVGNNCIANLPQVMPEGGNVHGQILVRVGRGQQIGYAPSPSGLFQFPKSIGSLPLTLLIVVGEQLRRQRH